MQIAYIVSYILGNKINIQNIKNNIVCVYENVLERRNILTKEL